MVVTISGDELAHLLVNAEVLFVHEGVVSRLQFESLHFSLLENRTDRRH